MTNEIDPTVQRILDILKSCSEIQERKGAAYVMGLRQIADELEKVTENFDRALERVTA